MKPAIAMAKEPANDLSQLYGSFRFPNRLPMMSAKPMVLKINNIYVLENKIISERSITISSTKIAYCSNADRGSPPVDQSSQSDCISIVQWTLNKFPNK